MFGGISQPAPELRSSFMKWITRERVKVDRLGFAGDMELNRAEWIVYDALYACCRKTVKNGKPDGAFK